MKSKGGQLEQSNEIILSFRPEYFKPILYGFKKYEYRKRFSKKRVKAYLYLSLPIQAIIGYMELLEPISLCETLSLYDDSSEEYSRIMNMMAECNTLAIPIKSLSLFEKPISLKEIQERQLEFKPPMSYAYLKNYSELNSLITDRLVSKDIVLHEHRQIYDHDIGRSCPEMCSLTAYQNIDLKIQNDEHYAFYFQKGFELK